MGVLGYTLVGRINHDVSRNSESGIVVLNGANSLPDGTEVTVAPIGDGNASGGEGSSSQSSVWDKMLELGRSAELRPCDLPADLAANHDHYLHGLPKRK